MSRNIGDLERIALWFANGKRCFYCMEPVPYEDLEIDHVIPRSTSSEELARIEERLEGGTVDVDEWLNLVPTHHICNRRKHGGVPHIKTILHFRDVWGKKQSSIAREIQRLRKAARAEDVITRLEVALEAAEISPYQVQAIAARYTSNPANEPLVLGFVIDVATIRNPGNMDTTYAALCDELEMQLDQILDDNVASLRAQTEPSGRDGEGLAMRYAFWGIDVNALLSVDISPWRIVEVDMYSDLYPGDDPVEFYEQTVVRQYWSIIMDDDETIFGLRLCPKCGSRDLKGRSATDYARDEVYYSLKCESCEWTEWTQ